MRQSILLESVMLRVEQCRQHRRLDVSKEYVVCTCLSSDELPRARCLIQHSFPAIRRPNCWFQWVRWVGVGERKMTDEDK